MKKRRREPREQAGSPDETYTRALRFADPDSVHDAIAQRGPSVLRSGVPYLLQAARWELASSRRTASRRVGPAPLDATELAAPPSLWDPFERAARSETMRVVALALADLREEEVIAVWDHFVGDSDAAIREKWTNLGLGGPSPSLEKVRKVRQRALERVKQHVSTQLGHGKDEP